MTSAPHHLGKFELLARIARGGMAEIFLARQQGMVGFSRLVVVKRILPHLAEERQFVAMFMQEAGLAAQLSHPNVVQIYDVGQSGESYYIAMEYIGGPSVSVICRYLRKQRQSVPFDVAAEIVIQACEGLHAAHELQDENGRPLGLVHRDVSPQNLILTEGGLVKLVDFGIAKAQGSAVQTRTGSIKGKYPYMSPEQCRGDLLDRRTDLFSLGIVLYEMVVGRRLFRRSTDLMVLKAITEEPLPVPVQISPELPVAMGEFVMRCLERERERRFATAEQMGQALRQVVTGLGAKTSPRTLTTFLNGTCRPLLESRAKAIRKLRKPDTQVPTISTLDGVSEESHSQALSATVPQVPRAMRGPRSGLSLRWVLLLSLVLVLLAAAGGLLFRLLRSPGRPEGPPLYFGFPPSYPRQVAQRELRPFLDYLERRVGRRVELVVPKDYRALRDGLLQGRLHLANLPPLQFVMARHKDPRVKVLVTHNYEGAATYQGYLLAGDKSGITTLEDLRGKRFCFVDPGSTSGYLLPRYFLRQKGLDPDRLFSATRTSGTHIAVMRDIVKGLCDAGAVYSGAYLSAPRLGLASSRLRLLAITGQLPYDVLCAAPTLPVGLARRIAQALLELDPPTHLGRLIVGPTFRISGFVPPSVESYDLVERAARSEGIIR